MPSHSRSYLHRVTMIILAATVAACSGGSSSSTPASTSTLSSTDSQTALKSNTLSTMDTTYCQAYTSNTSDPTAAFGCAIVTAAKLLDTKTSNTNLADFLSAIGESPSVDIQSYILDSSNANSVCSQMALTPKTKYCGNFSTIPFNGWCNSVPNKSKLNYTSLKPSLKNVLLSLKQKSIPVSQLQTDLFALDSTLANIITMLGVAKNSTNFSFVVPAGFCQLKADHTLNTQDAEGLYVLFATLRVTANVLHSYTVGLDLSTFVNSDGGVAKAAFVTDANGGADGKKFAELVAGQGNLSSFETLVQDTLNTMVDVLDTVKTPTDSVIFGRTLSSNAYKSSLSKIDKTAKDLIVSMQQNTLSPMTNLGKPSIEIDLNKGLSQLPDPKSISTADPFVINGITGKIQAVASFFKTLLTGIATF